MAVADPSVASRPQRPPPTINIELSSAGSALLVRLAGERSNRISDSQGDSSSDVASEDTPDLDAIFVDLERLSEALKDHRDVLRGPRP